MNLSIWIKTQKSIYTLNNMEYKTKIGEKELICRIENLAEQANGSCFLRMGETEVLVTAVMSDYEKFQGFFPLTVDYEERYYAAGKIRGPRYIKRETRPSDEAICNARLIDRAIRPLFPKDLKREVQVVATILSWDGKNDPDILSLLASSISLSISDIPWNGPLAVLRIGKIGNDFILNPIYEEREKSKFEIVFSGVKREKILINMIEASGEEFGEEEVLKAFEIARPILENLIDFQEKIKREAGKKKIEIEIPERDIELEAEIEKLLGDNLEKAIFEKGKLERVEKTNQLKNELIEFVNQNFPEKINYALDFFEKERERIIHQKIINEKKRPDGRKLDQMREISFEIGILPRTHGSGLFCRGQTKSLSILTLGAPGDMQLLEGMEITGKKRFLHHYNFPPYSAGEIKPMRGPGRREIGHGVLVEKALLPLIPSFEEFPYTIRVVSEILSSNGSTSMASVSSSSLALIDGGVPIKRPAAGIAIGLMKDEKGNYQLLTDIQGPEDQLGDMDLKVAGTKEGITAIQMDVKIEGIDEKILKEALEAAKRARLEILEKIEREIKPKGQLSVYAPRVLTLEINPEKIRNVIGPGGSRINEIIEECGVSIDIEPTGKIFVTGEREEAVKKAVSWIKNITREIRVGEVFQGKVKRILSFGALVELVPGQEGLIRILKLKRARRRIKVGEIVPVKVISIDELGRINLSLLKTKKHGKRS